MRVFSDFYVYFFNVILSVIIFFSMKGVMGMFRGMGKNS